jgi:hypothetical protein
MRGFILAQRGGGPEQLIAEKGRLQAAISAEGKERLKMTGPKKPTKSIVRASAAQKPKGVKPEPIEEAPPPHTPSKNPLGPMGTVHTRE